MIPCNGGGCPSTRRHTSIIMCSVHPTISRRPLELHLFHDVPDHPFCVVRPGDIPVLPPPAAIAPTRARAPALLSHLLLHPPYLLSSIAKSWSSVRHSPKLSLSLSSSSVCSLLSRSPLCLGTVPRRAHTDAASLLQPLVSQWQPLWRPLLLPKLTSLRESASSSPRSTRSGL
jgi:hypothetical protein